MKNKIRFIILVAILLSVIVYIVKCTGVKKTEEKETVSHEMVLTQVEALGNLQVVKYNIQDIVEYKKTRTFLPNSKTALVVVGEVTGCINLKNLKPENVIAIGDSVSLILPDPEICTVKVDHSKSRVYDVQYGLWEEAELIDAAYAYAEKKITEEAYKMGITADCEQNTEAVLRPILAALGFNKISISFEGQKSSRNIDVSDREIKRSVE